MRQHTWYYMHIYCVDSFLIYKKSICTIMSHFLRFVSLNMLMALHVLTLTQIIVAYNAIIVFPDIQILGRNFFQLRRVSNSGHPSRD